MILKGKLYLTTDCILRFDLDQPQKIQGLNEPVIFVLYEILQMAIQQFGKENVITAIAGAEVISKIELPDKIDSYLLPLTGNDEVPVGYS